METNDTGKFNSDISSFSFFVYFTFGASCVIICESILVIVIIFRTANLQTNTDLIVASLCINDILLCLAYIAHSVIGLVISRTKEQINKSTASLVLGLSYGTTITSYLHLGFASVDRYIHISHPFYYMKNMTRARNFKCLLAIWTVGLVYMAVPVFAYRDMKYHKDLILTNPPIEYVSMSYIMFLTITAIASTCYFTIARVAFQHKKAANVRRLQNANDSGEIMFSLNRKAALKSVKFFAVTFGLFLAFSSPMLVISAMKFFYKVPTYLYVFKGIMYLMNSSTNCLMYSFMRKEFLKSLKTAITDVLQHCKVRY